MSVLCGDSGSGVFHGCLLLDWPASVTSSFCVEQPSSWWLQNATEKSPTGWRNCFICADVLDRGYHVPAATRLITTGVVSALGPSPLKFADTSRFGTGAPSSVQSAVNLVFMSCQSDDPRRLKSSIYLQNKHSNESTPHSPVNVPQSCSDLGVRIIQSVALILLCTCVNQSITAEINGLAQV
ncbi:uncharacterized protein LOC119857184 isoform X7 [Dermochelys coriacea]|uniref:uncharacterized protein LOC119857184 isoform X7 n=1 Tax=Dermochelys coriacea TaxID=27794 RepID=UPI0018E6F6DF|nr:uncharacterized protein LOC119857184 isoform X7 [Dermochelys coriacea]